MSHSTIGGQFTLADGTALPLSRAVKAGEFVFLSGQLGLDEQGKLVEGVEAQTSAALRNIGDVLALAGLTLTDVVKSTVWLTDIADFPAFNRVYAGAFPDSPPARSTVCSALALPGALVEIEVVAYAG
ncbi:MAG: RidA family protein [Gammaproteobacteria bacterium]